MRKSNLHIHTQFCDGNGSPNDYCKAAADAGLESIGFSAHAPLLPKTGISTDWHLKQERLEAYRAALAACRAAWHGRLRVFYGLEADFIAGRQSPRDYAALGMDYLIGSVHGFIKNGAFLCVDGDPSEWTRLVDEFSGGDVYALVDAYWDAVAAMVQEGGFDILGHVDMLKKNNVPNLVPPRCLFDETDSRYLRQVRRIAGLLGEAWQRGQGIVVEVNTGGINRKRTTETYPALFFLKLLREQGVPVTINADSHRAEHICGGYDTAVKTLREAGYTEIALFDGRQGGRAVWQWECLG